MRSKQVPSVIDSLNIVYLILLQRIAEDIMSKNNSYVEEKTHKYYYETDKFIKLFLSKCQELFIQFN